jgi:hypothetical protein
MSRYKGRIDPKEVEKAFPHIVQMIVPLGGFGKKLDDIYVRMALGERHRSNARVRLTR